MSIRDRFGNGPQQPLQSPTPASNVPAVTALGRHGRSKVPLGRKGSGTEERMFKRISILTVIAVFGLAVANADQGKKKIVIPVDKTSPANARQMYNGYCAPCHGADGKGNGPVAPALKQMPTDLTLLSRNNGGKFPARHVATVLRFGNEIPAHGSHSMPVWGHLLANMDSVNSDLTDLRIANLTHYLESIQTQ